MRRHFLIFLWLSFQVNAEVVDSNHSAALVDPVNTSDVEKTVRAIEAVISKKSGLSLAEVKQRYQHDSANNALVVRQYREDVPANMKQNQQWFHAIVDKQKMTKMMLAQGFPIWPERRAPMFVMVVAETEQQPLAYVNADADIRYWLEKWFAVLGLPAEFYNALEDDLLSFMPSDVRYLEPDLIDYIRSENEVEHVLLVFVSQTSRGYGFRIGLSKPDQPLVIKNLQFVNLGLGMQSLATTVQGELSAGQQIAADEFVPGTVALRVTDVADANQMLNLTNYFDQQPLVEAYQVNAYRAKRLDVMLRIRVKPETFISAAEQSGLLQYVPVNELGQVMVFKMLP